MVSEKLEVELECKRQELASLDDKDSSGDQLKQEIKNLKN